MKVNLPSLRNKLQNNVCEIIFEKRRPKPGDRTTLNYKPPGGAPKYNPESKNLLPVWDIMMQGWRMVSLDNCEVVNEIPENTFFEYFNENIYPMSADEKRAYMGT